MTSEWHEELRQNQRFRVLASTCQEGHQPKAKGHVSFLVEQACDVDGTKAHDADLLGTPSRGKDLSRSGVSDMCALHGKLVLSIC